MKGNAGNMKQTALQDVPCYRHFLSSQRNRDRTACSISTSRSPSLSLSLLLRNRLNYFLSLSPRKVASRTSDAVVAARARACETDVVEVDLTYGLVVVGESDREMAIQKYRIVV